VLAGFLVAALVGAWAWRQRTFRRGLAIAALIAGGAAVTMAPWVAYASARAGHFVPITQGSASALFVGTYLPGGGTTVGMKMALEPQLRRKHPELDGTKTYNIPARYALDLFVAKHPGMSRDEALQREARHNLIHYSTTQPVAFAKMAFNKAKRMWFFYYRGGGVHYISTATRLWQIFLVIASTLGLVAGIWRRRDPVLAAVLLAVALSTAIHAIVVSQARYNLPLMPSLLAGGVAGWFLWARGRARAPDPEKEPQAAPLEAAAA
jgi:hypothetical protein